MGSNLAFHSVPGIVSALIENATEIAREESVTETVVIAVIAVIASENVIEIVSVTAIAKRNAGNTGVGRARKIVTAIETGESYLKFRVNESSNFNCYFLRILYKSVSISIIWLR